MKKFEKLDDRTFEKMNREEKSNVKGGYWTSFSIRTYVPGTPSPTGPVLTDDNPQLVGESVSMGSQMDTSYSWDGGGGGGIA
ncbi:MAG: hypothetical protein WBB45_10135 [Cyclobacteriaceae bacterium]